MNKKVLLAVLGLVLAGTIGFTAYNATVDETAVNEPIDTVENQVDSQEPGESDGEIEFSEDGRVVSYSGRDGETALEVLQSLTAVETEDSDFGEMVTAINDVKAGEGEFWAFYVNGQQASEGAGTYETTGEDKVEWRLESF